MTSWTSEQKEAIEKKGKNIIVSAGAGSGKTAVLSERVLTRLERGTNIDEMLILTFTNAAAGEMKERIRKKIAGVEGLEDQLEKIDVAYITTFDAYALSLVKKYNHLLNISGDINIIDPGILSIKKKEYLIQIFDSNYHLKEKKFLKLINDFCVKDDKELLDLIMNISNRLDNIYDKDNFLDSYLDSYYSDVNINNLIDEYLCFILRKRDSLKNMINYLESYTDGDYIFRLKECLASLFSASSYDEVKESLPNRLPSLPRGSAEEAKVIKESISSLIKDLKELTKYDDTLFMKKTIYETFDYALIILSIIRDLDKKILDFKNSINSYEFIDIAKFAIKILLENEDVRLELKNTYKEILIDEYQDTNDIQDMFVSLIENNNVYMVGDVKQSIYRFRNANPNLFKDKYGSYKNGIRGFKIDLNKNFRSRKEVIDSINMIFNLIMDQMIGGASYIDSHQMIYGNKAFDNFDLENYSLEVLTYEDDEKFTDDEIEIFSIASDIKKRIEKGYKIMDNDTKKERGVCYSDFVILMDRSNAFEKYKKIFEYLNIPLTVYKDEAISNSLDIILLRHILNIILNVNDYESVSVKYSIMSVLRSYLFNYKDDMIFDIIVNDKFKGSELYDLCFDIASSIDSLNIKELYDVILDRFDFYNKIISIGDIHEHLVTLDAIGKIISNLGKIGYTPMMLLDYLNETKDSGFEIKIPLNKASSNSVKIMTIHASKGLEYPICYFSGLTKGFNIREISDKLYYSKKYGLVLPYFKNGLKNTFLKPLLRDDYLNEEVSEKLRLFYVALTRTREKMIIVSKLKENILSYKDGAVINDDVRRKYKSFQDVLGSIYGYLKPYVSSIDVSKIGITKDYNLFNGNNVLEFDDTANTISVHEYKPCENEIVSDRFSKNIHELYSSDERKNVDFGILMHRVFEFTDFINPNYEHLTDYQKDKVQAFINKGILDGALNVYKEYEFMFENDGKQMHGIIDLLIEYTDSYAIVDYKLKNVDDAAYVLQLNGYKNYIESITGKSAHIYLYSIIDEELTKL